MKGHTFTGAVDGFITEIDGVSGSTITSDAVMKAAKSCYAQAKGEAVVSSVQLPTGDANDWLGKEPDIDEAAITETVDTDILIVGAGNGGMFAAAYAVLWAMMPVMRPSLFFSSLARLVLKSTS